MVGVVKKAQSSGGNGGGGGSSVNFSDIKSFVIKDIAGTDKKIATITLKNGEHFDAEFEDLTGDGNFEAVEGSFTHNVG